jgi:hypothetical protein
MGVELLVDSDRDHVREKLVNTVCLYKGEPVFVKESQEHRLQVSFLSDSFHVETVDYRTADFRYMGINLGYMNQKLEAVYLIRSHNHGTGSPAINCGCLKVVGDREMRFDSKSWLNTNEFGDCIKGIYPVFKDAFEEVDTGEAMSRAFHRHYAIRRVKNRLVITRRGSTDIAFIKGSRIIALDKRSLGAIEAAARGTEFNVETL